MAQQFSNRYLLKYEQMSNNLFTPAVKNLRHYCYFRSFCCQVEPNSFLNRRNLFQILFQFFFTRIFERLMGKRSIEPYFRAQTVALYQSGLNLSKISKQMEVSRCCVCNAITKFEEYTKFDDLLDQKVFLIAIYMNSKGWSRVIID